MKPKGAQTQHLRDHTLAAVYLAYTVVDGTLVTTWTQRVIAHNGCDSAAHTFPTLAEVETVHVHEVKVARVRPTFGTMSSAAVVGDGHGHIRPTIESRLFGLVKDIHCRLKGFAGYC